MVFRVFITVGDSKNVDVKFILFLKHNDWNVCAKNEVCNISSLGVIFKKGCEKITKMTPCYLTQKYFESS